MKKQAMLTKKQFTLDNFKDDFFFLYCNRRKETTDAKKPLMFVYTAEKVKKRKYIKKDRCINVAKSFIIIRLTSILI